MWQGYERALHRRPVPTQMATSAVLWGAGDVLAQRVAEGKTSKDTDKRRIAFYAFGSAAIDRSGWQGFKHKIDKDFLSTYMAELVIWPAFQTFNFVKIPVQHQLLAVNFMTLVDASFLSWARNQENWVSTVTKALSPK
ncbi:hypothetical protein DUNSADRAFT_5261 [Dunaliella salina]|uniref:Uncharacterized protein n=1 Tax=Dunaliella salina TaxID=3046 RepID=A0ABQ7GQP0_DUNSA|nr:hypothetical protein DUNSADRAFT_5261 [Dunaliella salina]|eukprot:KAF5836930.1 hypothetical protein DUNSADRAFT_5261 [Dunaliella salina]